VTLPEAEDGIVLSRRFGEKFLLSRFTKLVASIKKYTPTRRHP
jgi:hypothetical protein